MAKVGDIIRISRPATRSGAQPINEPWVRWLDTPDHLVALVDRTGDTTLDIDQNAVAAGEAEVRAASGGGARRRWERAAERRGGAHRRPGRRPASQAVTRIDSEPAGDRPGYCACLALSHRSRGGLWHP
jgi:hypothetical protein